MVRHLSRLAIGLGVLVVLGLGGSSEAKAQGLFGTDPSQFMADPFSFYYGVYLPNQQLQSLRATPSDTINTAVQARQYYAQATDRRGLYNPISPYAEGNYDPLRPYSQQNERRARPYRFSQDNSNNDGSGPSLYYNRAAAYFPTLRRGVGKNANVYSGRGSGAPRSPGRGGMGGMGMGGMGGGMGGMGGGMGGMGMM